MQIKNEKRITVVIVDDHRLFNDGLNAMLQDDQSIEVLSQIYDSRKAVDEIMLLTPDVILVDFNMPHLNGIELTKELLDKVPAIKILILSMYDEERHIEAFKKAGAKGYLFKTVSASEVITAIHNIHQGGIHFVDIETDSNHSQDKFLQKLRLSNREMEVIMLIKEGLKTKEIAERLNISFYTAETHRKNIKLKIGLKGETDFLKFIFEK